MTPHSRTFALGAMQVGIAASSWGLWSLFLRPANLPAFVSATIMLAVVALVSLVVSRSEVHPAKWGQTTIGLLVVNGLCDALNVVSFFGAMEHTTVALAVLSHYLAPLLVASAAPLVDGVRVPHAKAATFVGLVGLSIVLEPWRADAWPPGTLVGAGLGLVSAFGYAGNVLSSRKLVDRIGPARTQGLHALVSMALLAPLAFTSDLSSVTMRGVVTVTIASVVLGGASGLMFVRGLRAVGATTASTLTYLEPVVAVLVGAFVFGERLSATVLIGALLLVAAGVYVVRGAARALAPA